MVVSVDEILVHLRCQKVQCECEVQPNRRLCRFRISVAEFAGEGLGITPFPPSFSDICAHRSGRSPYLVRQAVLLFDRESACQLVDHHRRLKCELVNAQLSMILCHCHILAPRSTLHALRFTLYGCSPGNSSPARSSKPHIRFRHCTAEPAAPFIRLSMAHSSVTLRPSSTERETHVGVVAAGQDLRLRRAEDAGAGLDDAHERLVPVAVAEGLPQRSSLAPAP